MAASAARDLGQLIRHQSSHLAPVELGQAGKGHVIDIKVQPHPDGIRRHEIVDIPVLIHLHLRVAGARTKCAHNHRRTALLAAQKLCNGIYILNRKADDGRPRRHPAYLFGT